MRDLKIRLFAIVSSLLVSLLGAGCASGQDFDSSLSAIVKPYHFSLVEWECRAISHEVTQLIFGEDEEIHDGASAVAEYFSLIERMKALESRIEAGDTGDGQGAPASLEAELAELQEQKRALEDMAERIMEEQIKETLAQQGIFNPIDNYIGLKVNFPPVNFRLEKPPYLLVVSPRDRIESMREITLHQSLSLEEMEDIEAKADQLGVSSLVVGLGGLAAYPSFVTNDASLRFTINTATEEWLHQYLVFKPLGFLYFLDLTGICRNYEIATMNETLAGMVSEEIGSLVIEEYYPEYENGDNQAAGSGFDFDQEMREIRKAVDEYLAQGEIERAEEFMEQKRQYLASKGYHIRKLNQAYFAFHGAYADDPAFIGPIGLDLKELRSQSPSLREFLNKVAGMTSHQDLSEALNETR